MKKNILTTLSVTMLAACSSELADSSNGIADCSVHSVVIQNHPFEYEGWNHGLTSYLAWENFDSLGIFPILPNNNILAKQELSIPEHNSSTWMSYDNNELDMKFDNSYAAFVPYKSLPSSSNNSYDAVPIDFTGQDGTFETVMKKYNYMYASSSVQSGQNSSSSHKEMVFDFQHVISVLGLELKLPVEAEWESITLASMSESKMWVTSATINIATGVVTPTATSSEITLPLKNVKTSVSDCLRCFYVAVLPQTLGMFTLTAKTSTNELYTATLTGKTIEAGKIYCLTATPATTDIPSGNGYENGYAYVDLNLPSGLKWATMNIGATSVIDYGKYYAWGETKAKTNYNRETYKWQDISNNTLTKYCTNSSFGTVDNKITLDSEDDAATQNWGGTWRTPTDAELHELMENCYWVWTSSYYDSGIKGYVVYAAKSDSDKGQIITSGQTSSSEYTFSDNHIFIPAAGWRNSRTENRNYCGQYMSAMIDDKDNSNIWYLYFNMYGNSMCNDTGFDRYFGFTVRAVCE